MQLYVNVFMLSYSNRQNLSHKHSELLENCMGKYVKLL